MKKLSNLKPGRQVSGWLLIEQLDRGGNGVVWKASKEGREAALKFLKWTNPGDDKRLQRFRDEVKAMYACANIDGVFPIIEDGVSDSQADIEYAWFAMELGESLGPEEQPPLDEVVQLCVDLSRTLSDMHARGYSHRDIKPDNILRIGDKWHVADFGLVDFPEKTALTAVNEKLGPMFYIAPEMLNKAADSDGRAADVYSLGKLMWKMGSGQRYPLPGTQSTTEPVLRLSTYVHHSGVHSLDHLLEAMTQTDPARRPTMAEVNRQLGAWLAKPDMVSTDAMDLSSLAKSIAAIRAPIQSEQQRQAAIARIASDHRNRVFDAFRPFLNEAMRQLRDIGVDHLNTVGPSGGNGLFWRAVTNDYSVGNGGDGSWLYQFSHDATLSSGQKHATLTFGVNLAIHNLKGEKSELHNIYAPVLIAAGYSLHTRTLDGKEETILLWGTHGEFRYGQPDEEAVVNRHLDGLRGNLQKAVTAMVASAQLP
ncbi:protein kinase [Paraburkholderia sp. EG287A]|uniref:protein kinase domain-containing protein n=1 Tax=Paraburkholderia sp. EG287A TaxID=3237012 RepID=UPI0034D16279